MKQWNNQREQGTEEIRPKGPVMSFPTAPTHWNLDGKRPNMMISIIDAKLKKQRKNRIRAMSDFQNMTVKKLPYRTPVGPQNHWNCNTSKTTKG